MHASRAIRLIGALSLAVATLDLSAPPASAINGSASIAGKELLQLRG